MSDSIIQVSTDWLAARLDDANVRIVDASWYLPAMNRDGRAEYLSAHIPGAVYFDIDAISDPASGLPHMLPKAYDFAVAAGALGMARDDVIVVYDGMGLFSAPRVWWTFKVMGAPHVFVLRGGLPKWRAEGRALATGEASPPARIFVPEPVAGVVKSATEVLQATQDGRAQIVDMRPAERFSGAVPEPRPGLRSGHIPGSINLPFTAFAADGALHDRERLRQVIADAGIDITRPVITSCGSGVTAAFLNLALAELGVVALGLYDGSWTEWGGRSDLPVATGGGQ